MRKLHRDLKFDFSGKRTGNLEIELLVFSYLYHILPLTRNCERPVFCYEDNFVAHCSEIKRLLEQHTPGLLLSIWLDIFFLLLFPPTALQPFDEGQSRACQFPS